MSEQLNNISDATSRYCTGCAACLAVCPADALQYRLNDEGFYEAFVEENKCIHCGRCRKVCYKFALDEDLGIEFKQGTLYAAQSVRPDIVQSCTSGGLAYEIARYCLADGYIVVGVVYDYSTHRAKTVLADSNEGLELLKGSKYLQADSQDAFQSILKDAVENPHRKYVVFGTPCQIAGFKKTLTVQRVKNEILTVDLFCHGVPSYWVWDRYRSKYPSLQNVVFRSKKRGWHNFTLEIGIPEKIYYLTAERNFFYRIFFDNILLNKPCFTCKLRSRYSSADIRLGDFWGKKYQNREDGVSACLLLSDKGKEIFQDLVSHGNIRQIAEESIAECMAFQSNHNYAYWKQREQAFEELKNGIALKYVVRKYRKSFPYACRLKQSIKQLISCIPVFMIHHIKVLYRKCI